MVKPKASSLQAALDGVADAQTVADKPIKKKAGTRAKAATRQGTVLIGGHFNADVKKQLRIIAAEEDTTSQALLAEALNLLFKKKGKKVLGL